MDTRITPHFELTRLVKVSLWIYPEGIGPGPWQQAVIVAMGRELELIYNCFGGIGVKRVHVAGVGLKDMCPCGDGEKDSCSFQPDKAEPGEEKRLPKGQWHFIALTVEPLAPRNRNSIGGGEGFRVKVDANGQRFMDEIRPTGRLPFLGADFGFCDYTIPNKCKRFFAVPLSLGGGMNSPAQGFEGKMDDVSLWRRPLSDEELYKLYREQDGIPFYDDPTLAGAWSFDDTGYEDVSVPVRAVQMPQDDTGHPIAESNRYSIQDLSRQRNHLQVLPGGNSPESEASDLPRRSRHVRGPRKPWQGIFS